MRDKPIHATEPSRDIDPARPSYQAPFTGGVRFAPSPTGRFHIGNLRTAWISYQLSRLNKLPWVVRFEDIDRPRVVRGAQEQQLDDLRKLGLNPDVLLIQSQFFDRHADLFLQAVKSGQAYPCDCSRREVQENLAQLASAPHDGGEVIYDGHCRHLPTRRSLRAAESIAWRFRMAQDFGHDDFIIARTSCSLNTDGLPNDLTSFVPSYHWACAIDDHDGGYQLLVRSWDLLRAARQQEAIHRWVATLENSHHALPGVFHTALIVQNDGRRLEKRTRGVTLTELEERGLTPPEILSRFSASLEDLQHRTGYDRQSGESARQLPLRELNFS